MVAAAKQVGDEAASDDLGRIERTLTGQFLALDAIFATLAERLKRQEYLKQMKSYLRLALKAQAQAKATAEALALLKTLSPTSGRPTSRLAISKSTSTMHMPAQQGTAACLRARKLLKLSQINYRNKVMSNGWTPARRQRQSGFIKQWKPWAQATGPRSPDGKARVARNAWQGGRRMRLRGLVRLVNAEVRQAQELLATC